MSAHHPLWALLNSSSDVDVHDDNDNNIDKSPAKTPLLPPPPPPKREAAESSDHEIHIWTERERRKKMRTMFSNLHALLPHLPAKADKSTIVDEAVNYIKALEQSVQKLQKQKLEKLQNRKNNPGGLRCNNKVVHDHHPSQSSTREAFLADQSSSSNDMSSALLTHASTAAATAFQTWTSSNLVLSVCGGHAHFCVCSAKKPGLFAAVCYVLDKHQIHVVSAHVSSDFHRTFFMIQAHVNGGCDEFGAAMVAEEIFKQAAGEIIFWLSS